MKIHNFTKENNTNGVRVSADIHWEDCERPNQKIFFETPENFSENISCNPHAFLVACTMPAMRFGEKRISIDAEICPELWDGLITAMGLICSWFPWYDYESSPVRIEPKRKKSFSEREMFRRPGFLFSGGIDSLATLRTNRLHFNHENVNSIKDGILVYGLEINAPETFKNVMDSLTPLANDAEITLIPVSTNIRDLGPENITTFWDDFWVFEYMGAAFSSVAHILSGRISSLAINSCHDIPNLMPYGSHPLLNPYYSSSSLRIRHEGIHLSRFRKTEIVSGWDLALKHLRVCNRSEIYTEKVFNCGRCEKCVRTMLALAALNVLDKADAFPSKTVTEKMVKDIVNLKPNTLPLYLELLDPLLKAGRQDLVEAIKGKISEFEYNQKKEARRQKYVQPIIEIDNKYFNSNIKRFKNRFFDRISEE